MIKTRGKLLLMDAERGILRESQSYSDNLGLREKAEVMFRAWGVN